MKYLVIYNCPSSGVQTVKATYQLESSTELVFMNERGDYFIVKREELIYMIGCK